MTKTVTRLFEQFEPENYDLALSPDASTMRFSGSVTIRGKKTGRPSERITFHQKGLKITKATITKHDKKGDQDILVSRINNQDSYDEVRLHADTSLYPGSYTVTMDFEGTITKPMHGIYPCYFKHNGEDKVLIATQFESHHAREAFPCVDEPEAKATFDLSLTTPKNLTVLANTPVAQAQEAGDALVTRFETTPRMSTYLLAFVYGELGYQEAQTKDGVVVRTYATPAQVEQTRHSLDTAVKVVEFFDDYFGVAYPLPKLDMIALPDFSSGAMENWGLITYREVAMLLDEASGGIESRQYIATVVAHEISHQWFGNLVTMKWWDDLWLNESFATLMEYRAVDAIYPEWNIWEQFISHEISSAKRRDSLSDVQSIQTKVNHPDEISSLFDPSIVYAKGGTVLHMLMHHIGEEAFRSGLQAYFKKHRYGNTVAADLWEAFSDSSGQDIANFMERWISQPGYPIVSIDWQPGSETLEASQKRFLSDPTKNSDEATSWQVPLAPNVELETSILLGPLLQIPIGVSKSEPLIVNHEGRSYFLPHYTSSDHRKLITEAVKDGTVSTIDRLLLIDNYTMLQRGGYTQLTELLDMLPAFAGETSESVWGALAMPIAEARKLIEGDEACEDALNTLIAELTAPLVKSLGWDDRADDNAETLRLRGLIISLAAGAKVPEVIEEGLRRFATFKKPADLAPSTRSVVYFIGVRHGSQADFEKLLGLHNTSTNADDRSEYAGALSSSKQPDQYLTLIEMLKGEDIRRQDMMHWFVWLLRNRYARLEAWEWLVTNWSWIEAEYASDKSYSYFARYGGSIFSRPDEQQKFSDFFGPKKSIVALARDITLAEQEIASRVAWRERNEANTKAWLAARK